MSAKMTFINVPDCMILHVAEKSVTFMKDDEKYNVPRSTLSIQSDEEVEDVQYATEITLQIHDWKAKQLGFG